MRIVRHPTFALATVIAGLAAVSGASAASVSVHVERPRGVGHSVRVSFRAQPLPNGGYYYAIITLKPYRRYTRRSPPRCSTSSNMLRTDYGRPQAAGEVALALTPAKSATGHWCRGGTYAGAIYAVPHAPPCNSTYPCRSETYKEPCAGVRPGCVLGVVVRPTEWAYPEGPPAPRASDTRIVARFTVKFPR